MAITRRQIASLGLEAVDFQFNKVFFQELTLAVGKIRALSAKNKEAVATTGVNKLIKHHTNITITLEVDPRAVPTAFVFPPGLDINHALFNNYWRYDDAHNDSVAAIKKAKGGPVYGAVNRTTGRVSGYFAEIPVPIFISEGCLRIMTDEEAAAVILHEIGHCMSFFELLGTQMTANMALKAATSAFLGNHSEEQRYEVLMALEETLNIKYEDKDKLKNSDPQTLTVVTLKNYVEVSRSENGSTLYDYSGWEFMSDQYATRCGAGRALVTALNKLHRSSGALLIPALRSPIQHLFIEALMITVAVFTGAAWGAAMLGTVLATVVSGILFGAFFVKWVGVVEGMRIYDTPEARLKRVRNEVVASLKIADIRKNERETLLEDLAVIDKVLTNYHDRATFFEYIFNLFSPDRRREQREIITQQELERLVSNDLYVHAARFKSLSTS